MNDRDPTRETEEKVDGTWKESRWKSHCKLWKEIWKEEPTLIIFGLCAFFGPPVVSIAVNKDLSGWAWLGYLIFCFYCFTKIK